MEQRKFRKIPSLDFRYEVSRDGIVRNVKSKKIKKQQITIHGYYRTNYAVNKTNPHYKGKYGWDRPLHQLVMECWGPKQPSPIHIIDHIDRNKRNNDISNLRWVTHSENALNTNEEHHKKQGLALRNSTKVKRFPVELENKETGEKFYFKSRFNCAEWLVLLRNGKTSNTCGIASRLKKAKYIYGFKVHNINAERLGDMP